MTCDERPVLAVSLNDHKLAVVSTEGLNVVTCRVHGDVIETIFSSLDVSGGLYGEGGNSSHLLWVNDQEIRPGDEIRVTLLEHGTTSHAGKTIDELYPEELEPIDDGPHDEAEHFRLLAQQHRLRQGFRFRLLQAAAGPVEYQTSPAEHYFGVSVLWDWTRPTQARVSLHSSTLEDIRDRKGGTNHARFTLGIGESVSLRVLEVLP